MDIVERLDHVDRDFWRCIFVAHQNAANKHWRFNLELLLQALIVARKADDIDFACCILKRGLGIEFLIAFALLHAHAAKRTRDHDLVGRVGRLAPDALGWLAFERFGNGDDACKVAQFFCIFIQRMAGDKEAQHFLFVGQADAFFPVRNLGQVVVGAAMRGSFIEQSEEAGLPLRRVFLRSLRAFNRLVHRGHQRSALAHGVKRARFDQRLNHALVHYAQVNLFAELPETLEAPACFLASIQNGFDGVAAYVLYCRETEADGLPFAGDVRGELRS